MEEIEGNINQDILCAFLFRATVENISVPILAVGYESHEGAAAITGDVSKVPTRRHHCQTKSPSVSFYKRP